MLEKLFSLLGKSIESDEIKALFAEWNIEYPKTVTCTPNHSTVKTKAEKDGVKLYFTTGGNSRFLKPIPAKRANSYVGIFSMIEFTKKCKLELPFKIERTMTTDEFTAILGEPKVVNFVGETTMWRKNFNETQEIIVSHTVSLNDSRIESVTVTFNYEPDLNTAEDYERIGL